QAWRNLGPAKSNLIPRRRKVRRAPSWFDRLTMRAARNMVLASGARFLGGRLGRGVGGCFGGGLGGSMGFGALGSLLPRLGLVRVVAGCALQEARAIEKAQYAV